MTNSFRNSRVPRETWCIVFRKRQKEWTGKPVSRLVCILFFFFWFADPANIGKSHLDGSLWNRFVESLKQLYWWASATSLCSKIGIGGRQRIPWISTRKVRLKRISYERKSSFETLRFEVCTRWEKWRELLNYESTNSLYKTWEKVMKRYTGSLHKCRNCKNRWILWMIQENFKNGIEARWEIVLRSQSTSGYSKFTFHAELRHTLATWHTEYVGPQENVLVINLLRLMRPEIIIKELIILRHRELQVRFQCILVHGPLSQEMKDRTWSAVPMPTFARRPSTMSSLLPVDIPQNSVVEQQRQQISELQFDKLPTLSTS